MSTKMQWESTTKSHRATVRNLVDFVPTTLRSVKGKSATFVIGKRTSDSAPVLQSVVFDADEFKTVADAKAWWAENGVMANQPYGKDAGEPIDVHALGIQKRVAAVHAKTGGTAGPTTAPNPKQLELVNQYTRTPKTADEVAVFPIKAANDLIDRDIDRFPTDAIEGFMKLEGPLSPLGKSFMVGHDYSKLPIGRIFDGSVEEEDGTTWLKLWTYVPNTPQHQNYLENVDYGVFWAVSVGVMMGGATCSIGEPHDWGWYPYMCSAGHIKGERYTADAKTDKYDYPIPDDKGDPAVRNLVDPQDFYELSQVYLGAQYMAEMEKSAGPTLRKSLSRGRSVTLRADEAARLPHPMFPIGTKIAEKSAAGESLEADESGVYTYTDKEGLRYTFEVATGEELCLGMSADDDEDKEDEVDDKDTKDTEDESETTDDTEDKDTEDSDDEPEDEDEDDQDDEEEDEDDVDKTAALTLVRGAGLPAAVVDKVNEADSSFLTTALKAAGEHIEALTKQLTEKERMATLGDTYIKVLRADAIHWYTMAHGGPDTKGVKTDSIVKMLDACGDNAELIIEQSEMFKSLAQSKFPASVRRSSFPADVPEDRGNELRSTGIDEKSVSRIHG